MCTTLTNKALRYYFHLVAQGVSTSDAMSHTLIRFGISREVLTDALSQRTS
jgi:hypothetical protein